MMDTNELKERTQMLEAAVLDAVSQFNRETGLVITEFALTYGDVQIAPGQEPVTVLRGVSALLVVP